MKQFWTVCAIVLLAALVAFPSSALAQDNAWHQKDMVISAGIGIGLAGLYGTSSLPPIYVGFETGIAEKITLGGNIGYAGSSEDFLDGSWKYSYIPIEVRGAYHFLDHNPKIDAYGGIGIGYVIVSNSVTYTNPLIQQFSFSASGSYTFFDIFAGARYYFSPKFGAHVEVGYGLGFARIGVDYKLN